MPPAHLHSEGAARLRPYERAALSAVGAQTCCARLGAVNITKISQTPHPIPWATALVVALALLIAGRPDGANLFAYNRTAILYGELWRLWTGHLVHFSARHLGWDLLATAFAGAWIERAQFRGGRWLWIIAPPIISLILLIGDPTLERYGGLSGLATAAVIFACLGELRRADAHRGFWQAIFALVALKIGWEFHTGETIFAHFDGTTVRAVPLSHAAGAVVAVVISMKFGGPERVRPPPRASHIQDK